MEEQQQNLFNRFIEQPLVLLVAGTIIGLYVIGTLEERRQKRENDDRDDTLPFISDNEKELWEKFRQLYRQEISNPDKGLRERLDLLTENVNRLQENVETLLDRTEPSLKDEDSRNAKR
jgi:hypothetical protein